MFRRCLLIAAACVLAVAIPAAAFKRQFTTGISSGAFLAVQYHVAFSSEVQGTAVFSGGPVLCAQGTLTGAEEGCMYAFMPPSLSTLEGDVAQLASAGSVDPLSNLAGAPVWIFHGTSDSTVAASTNDLLYTQYQDWKANAIYNNATDANHAWISPSGPNSCTTSTSPYINNCPSVAPDPQKEFLTHLLGSTPQSPAASPSGNLTTIDQDAIAQKLYQQSASAYSMDTTGYIYVPASCTGDASSSCDLFIVLHGCLQGYANIGADLIDDANLAGYADTNNLVLLFPQAIATSGTNPNACWDWWGYTGSSGSSTYVTKQAPQMAIINAMTQQAAVQISTMSSKQAPLIATE